MKFIGIPKTVKKKNEALRSIFGAFLLLALISVCVVGAESVFTASRKTTTIADASSAVTPAPSSTEMAPLDIDATVPSLDSRSGDSIVLATTITAAPTDVTLTPEATPAETTVGTTSETSASITETEETAHYYVTAVLSIRTGPGTDYEKVGTYEAGEELETVASTSNGWKKLADGTYVISDYLSATPPETENIGTYYAIGEINVRSGPGTDYSLVKTLAAGDAISVVSETADGWYRTVKGTYVKASLCSSTPPATPTPAPTAAPTPTPRPTPTPTPAPGSLSLVGNFKITYYGPTGHTTATGSTCKEGKTIAVDPSVIPLGSHVYIEGVSVGGDGYFVAEDTGGDIIGNWIDIFAEDGESSSYNNGNYYNVYIVN